MKHEFAALAYVWIIEAFVSSVGVFVWRHYLKEFRFRVALTELIIQIVCTLLLASNI